MSEFIPMSRLSTRHHIYAIDTCDCNREKYVKSTTLPKCWLPVKGIFLIPTFTRSDYMKTITITMQRSNQRSKYVVRLLEKIYNNRVHQV